MLFFFGLCACQFDATLVSKKVANGSLRSIVAQILGHVMWYLKPIQRGFDQLSFVVAGGRLVGRVRGPVRIDDVNCVSPHLARANQSSAEASDHSLLSRFFNSCGDSNQSPSKMPIRFHSSNRRQHVRKEWKGRPPSSCSSETTIRCAMRPHCASVRYVCPASSFFCLAAMNENYFARTGTPFP